MFARAHKTRKSSLQVGYFVWYGSLVKCDTSIDVIRHRFISLSLFIVIVREIYNLAEAKEVDD